MDCKYELVIDNNILRFNSDKELSEYILNNKIKPNEGIKLSLDLTIKQQKVYNAIIDAYSENKYKNNKGLNPVEFLKMEHDLGKGAKYLAPFFDQDNYIKNAVKEKIKQLSKLSPLTEEDKEDLKKSLTDELKQELSEDNSMKTLGADIHSLVISAIEKGIDHKDTVAKITAFIEAVGEYNGKKYEIGKYVNVIKNEIFKVVNFINSLGTPIVKPRLINYDAEIKDRPDIVVVDNNGNAHIIDLSLSRKIVAQWDKAKLANEDYKLGIQRQLLQSILNTRNSGLYIAPFTIKDMDLDNFTYSGYSDRVVENKKLEFDGGDISNNLKILIPTKFGDLHVEDDVDENSEKVISAILPNTYNIQSKFAKTNKEELIESIKKNKQGNKFILYDNLSPTGKRIEIEKEEDIEKEVDKYLERYNAAKHSEVEALKRSIATAMLNPDEGIKFKYGTQVVIDNTFGKYLNSDWELVDNAIFTNQDFLVFRNKTYNTIDIVDVTTNTLNFPHRLGLGSTLLGKFRTDSKAKQDRDILTATTTNIEMVKVLAVINNTPELFDGYKLGNIKVLNYGEDKKWNSNDLSLIVHNFNELYKITSKDLGNIPNNFKNGRIKIASPIDQLFNEVLYYLEESKSPVLQDAAKGARNDLILDKLEWFKDVRRRLVDKNRWLVEAKDSAPQQMDVYNVYMTVSQAIDYYNDVKFSYDVSQSKFGVKFSDMTHLLQTWIFGEGREYDSKGRKISGLLQGSYFSTSNDLARDRTRAMDFISQGYTVIRSKYQEVQGPMVERTNKYYAECGRSGLEKLLIGRADPFHKVFFRQTDGEIDSSFEAKNPYDMSENLKDHERNYLKNVLWEMYKFKKKGMPSEYRKMSLSEFEKSDKFIEYTHDTAYLEMPLMKKLDVNKWSTLTTDGFRGALGKIKNQVIDSIDPRNMTEQQRSLFDTEIQACDKMFNEFDLDKEQRDKMVAEYGVGHFEINLDTLFLKFAYASIRENVMNEVLVRVNSALMAMKQFGNYSGNSKEINEAIDEMYKQVKISVYGIDPFDSEVKEPLAIAKQVQRMASIALITMRPILMFKELITGTIKNVSYAWTKVYGDDSFSIDDLKTAYDKVLFSKAQSFNDFNTVDHLNLLYGIANMDTTATVRKSKADRTGAFKFFSEHLYWMNNAPDYVNRLTLFVAKMVHDGCYDAHYVDSNGQFKYDPKKDKRFTKYFEKREKYGFKFAENDKDYNYQRSVYLSLLEGFNKENKTFNMPILDERKDLIPRAYTHEDRESIKIFADTAYGFYDHERSSMWKHTALGSIFGQFLTYWPSKVKYYFGKPMDSKIGVRGQKYETDEEGNRVPLWIKEVYDEEGNLIGTESTTENTGVPLIGFNNSIHEGLFYSLGLCIRELKNGNLDKVPEVRKKRAMLAIHDLFMGLLLAALIRVLLEDFDEVKDKTYTQQAMQGTTRAFYKATKEFDPFASVFTAFKWEPAFVSLSSKVASNFMGVISGNSTLEKLFRSNLKMLEVLPEVVETNTSK